eukprot:359240-Chlamydomonas_euryale.AAC.7
MPPRVCHVTARMHQTPPHVSSAAALIHQTAPHHCLCGADEPNATTTSPVRASFAERLQVLCAQQRLLLDKQTHRVDVPRCGAHHRGDGQLDACAELRLQGGADSRRRGGYAWHGRAWEQLDTVQERWHAAAWCPIAYALPQAVCLIFWIKHKKN